ncbi:hypothetical protein, partial [uncultured Devosia sp.]|uniref:hypothetical protein n=1 Tax=uncultured Devosia sp. TaxID=211434 RepID=UPI0026391470
PCRRQPAGGQHTRLRPIDTVRPASSPSHSSAALMAFSPPVAPPARLAHPDGSKFVGTACCR